MPRAVITGASSGIGAEYAQQLHARGFDVLLVARRQNLLEAACAQLNSLRAGSASYCAIDLSKPESEEFNKLENILRTETIDVLVSNAGIGSFGEFDTLNLERELSMVMLNVYASTRLIHAALGGMKGRKSGTIIVVSSIAGFQPLPYMATYAATKAFNFTQGLALHYEARPYGVQVLTVCPGPVDTEFAGVARVPGTASGGGRDSAEAVVRKSLKALDRRQVLVVPCLRAKLLALGPRFLPRTLATRTVAAMLRGVLRAATRKGDGA